MATRTGRVWSRGAPPPEKRPRRGGGRRGAVALEYVLIAGLVAIGAMGAFWLLGNMVQSLFRTVAWDSSRAVVERIK